MVPQMVVMEQLVRVKPPREMHVVWTVCTVTNERIQFDFQQDVGVDQQLKVKRSEDVQELGGENSAPTYS